MCSREGTGAGRRPSARWRKPSLAGPARKRSGLYPAPALRACSQERQGRGRGEEWFGRSTAFEDPSRDQTHPRLRDLASPSPRILVPEEERHVR